MATKDLTLTLSGGAGLKRKLAELAGRVGSGAFVKVGFLEGVNYPDGTPVAAVAFWNEFGTSRIPARPAFRAMIAAKSRTWGPAMAKAAQATGYDTARTLALVGTGIKDQLVQSIVGWTTPGNAPSTIARKGFDKPLVDTGVLQRTPDFEVVEGNGTESA